MLSEVQRARLVWGCVVRQDLIKLIGAVKARGSNAGRAAIDPHILFFGLHYSTANRLTRSAAVSQYKT